MLKSCCWVFDLANSFKCFSVFKCFNQSVLEHFGGLDAIQNKLLLLLLLSVVPLELEFKLCGMFLSCQIVCKIFIFQFGISLTCRTTV